MRLIEAFVRNPVKVAVGVLMVALFGVISLMRLPMQLTPEVQVPTITVETMWPGASPEEVEREIVQEQEEQLKSVEGLTELSSTSSDSRAQIELEFVVGTEMTEALLKVNARLQQVPEYPEDADEPVISTSSASDRPIAWFILRPRVPAPEEIAAFQREHPGLAEVLEPVRRALSVGLRMARLERVAAEHPEAAPLLPPPVDVPKLRRFAENVVEASFERVPGVSNANVLGGREEELQVVVDPRRLAARSLTVLDVREALRRRNVDVSAGDLWEGKRRYVVRTMGRLRTLGQVEGVVLARRDDVPVYLRDVAEVRLGFKKPTGMVQNFGTTSIAVNAVRETGANVLEVMEGLREARRRLNDGPLAARGLWLEQTYDETEYIDSAVGLVQQNIFVGGVLTIAVLLLFLRSVRSTLVLALAIPTSIVGTFLVLDLMDRSLNVVSLAGLAFAVGMLVDNAVVVLENVYRHHQQGEGGLQAIVRGTTEVWGAVVASTLTTLAVFVPVLFVEEEAGQLFRDIAIAISAAVGLSMVVSVIVIPTASARLLRRTGAEEAAPGGARLLAPVDAFARRFVGAVVGANAWIHARVWRQLAAVLVLAGGAVLVSWALMPKVEYLPSGNRNLVFGILLPPPGYNLDELVVLGAEIEERLRPYWDVDPDDPHLDELPFPPIKDFFYVARNRQLFLGLRSADPLRAGELIPMIQQVASSIPGMFAIAKQSSLFEQGLSAGRNVDVEITGPDLETLIGIGRRVFAAVRDVLPSSQAFPQPSLDLSNPEVHVVPHLEKAADLGVTVQDLGYTVDAFVDGAYATDYFIGGDEIDLSIIGDERVAERTQDLEQIPVVTPTGDLVPLGTLADVVIRSGPEQIDHRERQRAITIQVSPPPEVALEDAMERIESEVVAPLRASGALGEGVRIRLAGTADKLRATWSALGFNVILALLITYLLMAALFESWVYPFVIIFSVPLAAVGGFAGLWLLNRFVVQPLDVLTMLGFVILIGTSVNNAILIVHQALQHMREGMAVRDSVLDSVRTRIRPIFMTTITTVSGLIPLVVFPGAGAELYRGLGSVVLGGLLVSSVFTLFLVPTLFTLMLGSVARVQRATARIRAA